jgi:hypothetical protein
MSTTSIRRGGVFFAQIFDIYQIALIFASTIKLK